MNDSNPGGTAFGPGWLLWNGLNDAREHLPCVRPGEQTPRTPVLMGDFYCIDHMSEYLVADDAMAGNKGAHILDLGSASTRGTAWQGYKFRLRIHFQVPWQWAVLEVPARCLKNFEPDRHRELGGQQPGRYDLSIPGYLWALLSILVRE